MADPKPILVPLDGSKIAEHALPDAAWLAKATGASIRFIHVVELNVDDAQVSAAAETFRAYTKEVAAEHGLANTTCDVVAGAPADQILDAASDASAIVIGTHGRGGFKAMMVGSVADKVIRGAEIPVLVEPGAEKPVPPGGGRPILVGLDGSEEGERGLAMARELAAASNLPLVLVRAFSIPPPAGIEFTYYPADLATTLEDAAKEYLQATAKPGEKALIMQGDAAGSILDVSEQENASLIVVSSTGKGLAKRIALGSTTDRIVHRTKRPVLIVPKAR